MIIESVYYLSWEKINSFLRRITLKQVFMHYTKRECNK